MTTSSLHLLPSIEIPSATSPAKKSLIWLHGLGADGNDFVPIVNELHLPLQSSMRFIFPHAPIMPITINNGFEMRAWYDIRSLTMINDIDITGITRSVDAIEALIAAEIARGVPREHILLGGFSQGAVIALYTALSGATPLHGVIALSGYLPMAATLLARSDSSLKKMPIFIAHGTEDTVVPAMLGQAAAVSLQQAGYQVSMHTYPIAHSVCVPEINDLSAWIHTL